MVTVNFALSVTATSETPTTVGRVVGPQSNQYYYRSAVQESGDRAGRPNSGYTQVSGYTFNAAYGSMFMAARREVTNTIQTIYGATGYQSTSNNRYSVYTDAGSYKFSYKTSASGSTGVTVFTTNLPVVNGRWDWLYLEWNANGVTLTNTTTGESFTQATAPTGSLTSTTVSTTGAGSYYEHESINTANYQTAGGFIAVFDGPLLPYQQQAVRDYNGLWTTSVIQSIVNLPPPRRGDRRPLPISAGSGRPTARRRIF